MTDKIDGGAAFPHPQHETYNHQQKRWEEVGASGGMSLRDWFAGQALVAMGTWSPDSAAMAATHKERQKLRAEYAYAQADALLAERGKQ